MNLLILEQLAEEYRKALQPKFPEVIIHAAKNEDEIGDFIEKMDILLTFRISEELIRRRQNSSGFNLWRRVWIISLTFLP